MVGDGVLLATAVTQWLGAHVAQRDRNAPSAGDADFAIESSSIALENAARAMQVVAKASRAIAEEKVPLDHVQHQ